MKRLLTITDIARQLHLTRVGARLLLLRKSCWLRPKYVASGGRLRLYEPVDVRLFAHQYKKYERR